MSVTKPMILLLLSLDSVNVWGFCLVPLLWWSSPFCLYYFCSWWFGCIVPLLPFRTLVCQWSVIMACPGHIHLVSGSLNTILSLHIASNLQSPALLHALDWWIIHQLSDNLKRNIVYMVNKSTLSKINHVLYPSSWRLNSKYVEFKVYWSQLSVRPLLTYLFAIFL